MYHIQFSFEITSSAKLLQIYTVANIQAHCGQLHKSIFQNNVHILSKDLMPSQKGKRKQTLQTYREQTLHLGNQLYLKGTTVSTFEDTLQSRTAK